MPETLCQSFRNPKSIQFLCVGALNSWLISFIILREVTSFLCSENILILLNSITSFNLMFSTFYPFGSKHAHKENICKIKRTLTSKSLCFIHITVAYHFSFVLRVVYIYLIPNFNALWGWYCNFPFSSLISAPYFRQTIWGSHSASGL